jgi:cell division protein FtsI/penicillin-binding protein 2
MASARNRILVCGCALGALICVVIARLAVIQIVRGHQYSLLCKSQSKVRVVLQARRGIILDCKARILAVSSDKKVDIAPEFPVAQADGQTRPRQASVSVRRVYPYGELAGTVLGYVGKDGYGLGGAEFAFDNFLRGENGWAMINRDGRNNRYRTAGLPDCVPRDGSDCYLTIDIDMQNIAQNVLQLAIEQMKAKGGMCMIMAPRTGAILAMCDEPGMNPNAWDLYPPQQRQNQCISSVYEPGSTFKIVTASSALEEGIKREQDIIDGNRGVYEIYNQKIRDKEPFGKLTFAEALAYSSNVCFAKIANEVGNERFYKYAKDFGFGAKTGMQLPGEESGIVHPVAEWSGRTRVTMAIGQEIATTFLQMMLAFGTIANDGVLVKPFICEKIMARDGSVQFESRYTPVRRVISSETARRMRYLLKNVIDKGTAVRAQIEGVPMAGKTGTSQKVDQQTGAYSNTRYWSSFIGFVPVEQPVLLCGVMIDEPSAGETGGLAAAPAFKKIITQIITNPDLDYAERILGRIRNDEPTRTLPARPVVQTAQPEPANGTGKIRAVYAANCMPDCISKDARDAVGDLCAAGFMPIVHGKGLVRTQFPAPGTPSRKAEACTLYCAIDKPAPATDVPSTPRKSL